MRSLMTMGLIATLICLPVRATEPEGEQLGADMHALGRQFLNHLVCTNTSAEFGSTPAAQWIFQQLRAEGFGESDLHLLAPDNHPERANVVVRLHGNGKRPPLLYIGHLDVVAARREDWSMDPFVLNEQDGWLYGRGTIDMKGQDSAMLVSLIAMKRKGLVPDRDIIVALTADEEQGDANGVQWLLAQHRPLVDAGLAINPDGGEAGIDHGRHAYLVMQTSEKVYMTFQLETTDKGGHSSRPTPGNPIYRLAAALQRLSAYQFPMHLTETTRLYFARRASMETGTVRQDMLKVGSSTRQPDQAALERLSHDINTDILLRSTCTSTMVEGGHAENALPQRARATVQCRIVPGESQQVVQRTLTRVLRDSEVAITPIGTVVESPESTPDPNVMATLERVTHAMWPGVAVLPQMSPGASDSIYTRVAGIPTFGIDAMFTDIDDDRFHGKDERISVAAFDQELDFTFRLMQALSGLD